MLGCVRPSGARMYLYQNPERVMNLTRNLCAMIALLSVALMTGGCVSSALDSVGSSEIATDSPPKELSFDPAAREQAVAEMRAKAADQSNENANAFQSQDNAVRPLSASEADEKIRALNASTSESSTQITDEELDAKQRSIAELRHKAKSHYSDALKKIEN